MHVMGAAPTQGTFIKSFCLDPCSSSAQPQRRAAMRILATNNQKDQLRGWAFCTMGKDLGIEEGSLS